MIKLIKGIPGKIFLTILILNIAMAGCKKFLDTSPDKKLVIPSSLADLQGLLDYNQDMNQCVKGIGEGSSDDYYLTDASWNSLNEGYRNMYTWGNEIFFDMPGNEYQNLYKIVYNANVVLKYIEKIPKDQNDRTDWDNIKGQALFFRAQAFQNLTCDFSKEYDSSTASSDLGIPLRLDPDFNAVSKRASVKETYDQIIKDLVASLQLLPVIPLHVMRPSKPAAYGLLARTYLSMRNYSKALVYSDSCLQYNSNLIDYSTLDSNASFPMPRFNMEVIFHANGGIPPLSMSNAKIDSNLYRSYDINDLRKTLFFKENSDGSFAFRGSYFQTSSLFQGIAVDEMFLIKAECLARSGNTQEAMDVLNSLMVTRWEKGAFIPFSASSPEGALNITLLERRKELVMRNLRWMDLKRLNMDSDHQTTIKHVVNGQVYELKPNDPRYALPLPQYVLDLTGMPQNPTN